MAAQQVQFAETIRAMKVALKRRADDSDSDTLHITHPTNRGHKLQKGSKHVRAGNLDTTGGVNAYRKKVTHAGYTRTIISTNPPNYTSDGSPLPSDDEREASPSFQGHAFGSGEVPLEALLRPLTRASELENHPGLSTAYKSQALTQMVEAASEMVRREKASLWKAKRLLMRLRGDGGWLPCEVFETADDEVAFLSTNGQDDQSGVPSTAHEEENVPEEQEQPIDQDAMEGEAMSGVEKADMAVQQTGEARDATVDDVATYLERQEADANGNTIPPDLHTTKLASTEDAEQPDQPNKPPPEIHDDIEEDQTSTPATIQQHAMTTRTRARARSPDQPTTSRSPSPSSSASIPDINPWFLPPANPLPSPDLGLPPQEATETRRLLLLYVQKQEHVVRQLQTLFTGLHRADRLRTEVWRSAKAEGHVGEMSDGEDWIDPADYGLRGGLGGELRLQKDGTYGLEKGKDEVDEGAEEEGRRGGAGGRRRRVHRM